ncbi:MAG: alkaline phosphatase family protein [Bacteroidales bacterium]|nr:MAG: alkaline phosphatase family protein [Bacteroidales bacterium]
MKLGLNNRFGGILLLYFIFIIVSFISRTVLLSMSFHDVNLGIGGIFWAYGVGLFFDTVAFSYFMIPYVLFTTFISYKLYSSRLYKWLTFVFYFITFYIFLFNGVSEYFFWEEFGVRYNFIAVDYLIYTTEVIGNIQESYPMPAILMVLTISSLALTYFVYRKDIIKQFLLVKTTLRNRIAIGAILLILPVVSFIFVSYSWAEKTNNRYNNELAKNGVYSIFAAFLNNELDYNMFYKTQPNEASFAQLRSILKTENSEYQSADLYDISRVVKGGEGEEKRFNVIMITVESLSGEFLEYLGSKRGKITPYLDSLSNSSLFFTNMYATGTRTIWGLEAVALSAPPKPGQSVIKRPNSENMFSLGQLFKARGYELKFVYGGNGYFDNMNYFFENNGYQIMDKRSMEDSEITFANAWGVCDQDLFTRVIKEADMSYAEGKPFLNLAMTTSNHRPFTYPDGFIDIKSPGGRVGAVKYCDYAIGELIQKAKTKPWFNNTIFVIVADHCAGSAGQTELPVLEYQIPCLIYNPNLIPPQRVDKLVSQIDLGPTLLGLMNWTYKSKFFGKDILKMTPADERAFIANYQKLGFIKDDRLTILSPQQKASFYKFNRLTGEMIEQSGDDELLKEAVIFYQSASYVQKMKLNKWEAGWK